MAYAGELKTASTSDRKAAKKLDRITIKPAKNGGHSVEHHYQQNGMGAYHEPDVYAFGSGPETIAHLNDHLGVKENKKVGKLKGDNEAKPGGKAKPEVADDEPTVHQGNRRTRAEQRGHS